MNSRKRLLLALSLGTAAMALAHHADAYEGYTPEDPYYTVPAGVQNSICENCGGGSGDPSPLSGLFSPTLIEDGSFTVGPLPAPPTSDPFAMPAPDSSGNLALGSLPSTLYTDSGDTAVPPTTAADSSSSASPWVLPVPPPWQPANNSQGSAGNNVAGPGGVVGDVGEGPSSYNANGVPVYTATAVAGAGPSSYASDGTPIYAVSSLPAFSGVTTTPVTQAAIVSPSWTTFEGAGGILLAGAYRAFLTSYARIMPNGGTPSYVQIRNIIQDMLKNNSNLPARFVATFKDIQNDRSTSISGQDTHLSDYKSIYNAIVTEDSNEDMVPEPGLQADLQTAIQEDAVAAAQAAAEAAAQNTVPPDVQSTIQSMWESVRSNSGTVLSKLQQLQRALPEQPSMSGSPLIQRFQGSSGIEDLAQVLNIPEEQISSSAALTGDAAASGVLRGTVLPAVGMITTVINAAVNGKAYQQQGLSGMQSGLCMAAGMSAGSCSNYFKGPRPEIF